MSMWFTEKQTANFGITAKVNKTLAALQTDYQDLKMVETVEWGNMLLLDDMVMTTEKDEFVYHEMVAHVPLFTHPSPKHVLVVGGGDGGVIREVLRHPSVQKATLVDIDGEVIHYSKKYLPTIAGSLDDERVEVKVDDGFMFIANSEKAFDVILVDSTEPVGPAVNLFTQGFYAGIHKALKDDGIFVAQTDNPWFKADLIHQVFHDVKEIFPVTRLYTANIPTYPSGLWTFTIGSKIHDPLKVKQERFHEVDTKYYTPEIHFASFALPKFVKELTE
ncbi:spermidine synthase [Virgibacillus halodenitrificans]|uniref:spermidine synthase n=1 Tax=Virgibacillus halodenitrificans TaxID=1482 RepID=UPI00045CA8D5|nr:spermidine synthase [Virgibacillus halodenitrificans]MCJ0932839.1 spermidine synthase [Virgibacillus halodenitrificans]MYL45490.1 spermidine synthase [Virgibacillus halodenitrificans]CDQ31586.1 Spermidine synthase [Virgibacillus halodenitrificans]